MPLPLLLPAILGGLASGVVPGALSLLSGGGAEEPQEAPPQPMAGPGFGPTGMPMLPPDSMSLMSQQFMPPQLPMDPTMGMLPQLPMDPTMGMPPQLPMGPAMGMPPQLPMDPRMEVPAQPPAQKPESGIESIPIVGDIAKGIESIPVVGDIAKGIGSIFGL